jgi:hypothetical protein
VSGPDLPYQVTFTAFAGVALIAVALAPRFPGARPQPDPLPAAEWALNEASTDLRAELTQRLMVAAQNKALAHALRAYLSGKPVNRLGRLCLALALRGGGGSLEGLEIPAGLPEETEVETLCALLGLKAMMGEEQSVERLEHFLREGSDRERYSSAVYLGLARVRSAVPIFASVSDQDAPWPLRSLCAGMLVQRGHGFGVPWFNKNVSYAQGVHKARLARDFSRAIEEVIPLMLECADVNLGRFV